MLAHAMWLTWIYGLYCVYDMDHAYLMHFYVGFDGIDCNIWITMGLHTRRTSRQLSRQGVGTPPLGHMTLPFRSHDVLVGDPWFSELQDPALFILRPHAWPGG